MTTCPNCGTENPAHARFCLGCGSPLAEAAPAAENARSSPSSSSASARATIAQTGGEDATRLFEEAAEGWGAFGCRLEHALALRGVGQETEAAAILGELGVVATPVQTAARTAK